MSPGDSVMQPPPPSAAPIARRVASNTARPTTEPAGGAATIRAGSAWPTKVALPLGVAAVFLVGWHVAVRASGSQTFPGPIETFHGLKDLAIGRAPAWPGMGDWGQVAQWLGQAVGESLLLKYIIASLYRVTWGFALAVLVGVPLGLLLGWSTIAFRALNPLMQVFRPISPIAWIPIAILWFGVTDSAPIFLIFLASVFPIALGATAAVQNIQPVYVRAARNFGLSRTQLFARVIIPATLPQIVTSIRIALGVAWLVVVAAEMIATDPKVGGLGYLINDARNAGRRYDLIAAGMLLIGLIGLGLDLLVRQLEKFDELRWGYSNR